MSIGDGVKIKITFDQPLIASSVDGLYPIPAGGYKQVPIDWDGVTVTALNQYSTSYPATNVIDGSTSTYWRGTTQVNWLKFALPSPRVITSFRMYLSSYYVKTCTFAGSHDGENWVQLGDSLTSSSGTSKWYEFEIPNNTQYEYYQINTETASSTTQVNVYEVELCESVPVGNEKYFSVTVPKLDYSTGEEKTVDSTKTVTSVQPFYSVHDHLDLSSGVYQNLMASNGVLAFADASDALNGFAEYEIDATQGIASVVENAVTWAKDTADGATVCVLSKVDGGEYAECQNGGALQGVTDGMDLTNSVLYVKIEMERTTVDQNPTLTDVFLHISDARDARSALLTLPQGNQNSIQNAVGDVTVHYDGHGFLRGEGGGVQPFDFTFSPRGLVYKGDQNDAEHIEISDIAADGILTRIYYTDAKSGDEHIEITNITAVGVLTHIDDI